MAEPKDIERERIMRAATDVLLATPGILEGPSVFSDDDSLPGFFVNGTQIAHFGIARTVELRLTRKVMRVERIRLKADQRVYERRAGSEWIVVDVRNEQDLTLLANLAELAAAAHRPPDGVALKPPPTGSDLARRRRFH